MRPKISVAPPTEKQLEAMRDRLKQCQFVETAATLVGIPRRMLTEWIRLGRLGRPEFVPFVDMLDKANSELAEALIGPIKKSALEDGNIQAAQWLYKTRIEPHEKRFLAKQFEAEDAIDVALGEDPAQISEEDIAAAEARALAETSREEVH